MKPSIYTASERRKERKIASRQNNKEFESTPMTYRKPKDVVGLHCMQINLNMSRYDGSQLSSQYSETEVGRSQEVVGHHGYRVRFRPAKATW